ncbi:unnamed protein product, partial [Ectocarpus fasciculatus]
ADRAWRRRGWLVMRCSRTLNRGLAGGDVETRPAKHRSGFGVERQGSDLVAVVAKLGVEMEEVFRNVVSFL